jgi:hypothetical protein
MEHGDLLYVLVKKSFNRFLFKYGCELKRIIVVIPFLFLNTIFVFPQEIKKDSALVTNEYIQPLEAILDQTGFLQLRNFTRADGVVMPILEIKIFEDVLKTVAGKGPGSITEQDVLSKMKVNETIILIFNKGVAAVRVCPYRTIVEGMACEDIVSYEIVKHPKDENLCVVSINGKNKFIARTKGKPIEPTIWKYKK